MLIYLCVNSAFVSVARLDFGVFGACLKDFFLDFPEIPEIAWDHPKTVWVMNCELKRFEFYDNERSNNNTGDLS